MKFGIKLWSKNDELYSQLVELHQQNKFDYLELTYVPSHTNNLDILINANIPIVVHAPVEYSHKVCFSDNNLEKNQKIFNEVLNFANKLNAKKIIVHPDFGEKNYFVEFLKNNQYSQILIENMPRIGLHNKIAIGFSPEEIKEFLNCGPFNFCLDFTHAVKAALSLNLDYKDYIKKFMELNPKMFHIGGCKLNTFEDEHLDLWDSEYDLKFIKELIKNSNQKITFEGPNKEKFDNDLKNIQYFKNI